MATAFPDAKPWPKAAAEQNPRASIGDNKPPLEESIVLDFEEALRARDGLIARIEVMEVRAADPKPCTSAEQAGRYGDFIKMANTAAKAVEEEREKLNRPLLTAQRSLKAKADSYSGRATVAGQKVRTQLDAYLAEQDRLRRIEEKRVADELRATAAAAEAERQRLQKIEDDRAAEEQRPAEAIEVEPEPVFVSAPIAKAPLRGDYGTTVSTTENWHVEVVNIRQVPDAYLKHPAVLEALAKVLGPLVRPKNGLREIKGCRVWSTTGSAVR